MKFILFLQLLKFFSFC